jgi:hypothetical protein
MTLPRKDTHTINVGGELYSWHRSRRFERHNRWTVIRKKDPEGQFLLLDPYHHDLSFGAGAAAKAIEFAMAHGWTPEKRGTPMKLRYNGDNFHGEPFTVLLPEATLSDR